METVLLLVNPLLWKVEGIEVYITSVQYWLMMNVHLQKKAPRLLSNFLITWRKDKFITFI